MSIKTQIARISGNVEDALTAIANEGVTVPSDACSDDLADLIGEVNTLSDTTITMFEAAGYPLT